MSIDLISSNRALYCTACAAAGTIRRKISSAVTLVLLESGLLSGSEERTEATSKCSTKRGEFLAAVTMVRMPAE